LFPQSDQAQTLCLCPGSRAWDGSRISRRTRGFFNLPLDEKQKYSNLTNGKEFRFEGYGNDMVLSEDQVLDWCDRLYLTVEPESRIIRSLWPAQPPAFCDVLREYTARCWEIAGVVLTSLARLLGLHEGRFVVMMDEGVAMTHARFNYYPRCPEPDLVFGLKPHSDASVITVVLIDDAVSGLQVQKPNDGSGVWYDVPIVPKALLFERFARGERALDTVKIDLNDD